jgi:hypothetical protein
MFHKACNDTYVLRSNIDYIWEKYTKMIGFDPVIRDNEFSDWWQSVVVTDFKAMSLKLEWMDTWNKSGKKLDPKKERVLNYLCLINIIPNTPNRILKLFKEYIGDVDNIREEVYPHIHPHLEEFIGEYRQKFRRELNLEILT